MSCYQKCRQISLALVCALTFGGILPPLCAQAAEAEVEVEETLYLNLNAYGRVEQANVVKGLHFNGRDSYTDYGSYLRVLNMSDEQRPSLEGDSVRWQAPKRAGTFFFQGELEPHSQTLPWDFDLSYRLNGVPTDADKLGGRAGLIQIDIHAEPNTAAPEYMQNNMMLLVTIPIDEHRCYSVQAPGAQIMSLGQYKAAVFSAVPGEKADFTVQLGSDDFSMMGIMFTLSPVTLKDADRLKQLGELRDEFRDDADAMLDELDQTLGQAQQLSAQLSQSGNMLDALQSGKDKLQNGSERLFAQTAESLKQADALAAQLTPLQGDLDNLQGQVNDVNVALEAVSDALWRSGAELQDLQAQLSDMASEVEAAGAQRPDTSALRKRLTELRAQLRQLAAQLRGLRQRQQELTERLERQLAGRLAGRQRASASEAMPATEASESPAIAEIPERAAIAEISERAAIAEISERAASEAELREQQSIHFTDISVLDKMIAALEKFDRRVDALLSEQSAQLWNASRLSRELRGLMSDSEKLISLSERFRPQVQQALSDSRALMEQLQLSLHSASAAMNQLNELMKAAEPDLSRAADEGLRHAREASGTAAALADSTGAFRASAQRLREHIENKLDETEAQTNLLKLDPEAPKISLTSDKNQEPSTIAIIARTAEIKAQAEESEAKGEAQTAEKQGIWFRLRTVFVRMWEILFH